LAVMENGQVTTVGLPTQVFDNPMWREVLY